MEIHITNKCRCCLSDAEQMHYLFGEYDQGYSLAEILETVISPKELKIEENDGFPCFLCEACTTVIINFFNLKVIFEENEKHIRGLLENTNKGNNMYIQGSGKIERLEHENEVREIKEDVDFGYTETSKVVVNVDMMPKKCNTTYRNENIAQLKMEKHFVTGQIKNSCNEAVQDSCSAESNKFSSIQVFKQEVCKEHLKGKPECIIEIVPMNAAENCNKNHSDSEIKTENFLLKSETDKNVELPIKHERKISEDLIKPPNYSQKSQEIELVVNEPISNDDNSLYELEEFRKYSCPLCAKYFFNFSPFETHMRDVHEEEIVLPDMYNTVVKMKVRKLSTNGNSSTCIICGENCLTKSEFKSHMNTHKKFICEECGMGFFKKSYLLDHKEVHAPTKRHVCPFCNKAFQRRTVLVKHRRLHTNPREHICEICGQAFNDKAALKTHIKLLHIKDRNFRCLICDKDFPLKATLQKHMLRHNKLRESLWICKECDMSYKDKSSLNRHILLKHSANSKVTCEYCGKRYTASTNLNKHIQKHHQDCVKKLYEIYLP